LNLQEFGFKAVVYHNSVWFSVFSSSLLDANTFDYQIGVLNKLSNIDTNYPLTS